MLYRNCGVDTGVSAALGASTIAVVAVAGVIVFKIIWSCKSSEDDRDEDIVGYVDLLVKMGVCSYVVILLQKNRNV